MSRLTRDLAPPVLGRLMLVYAFLFAWSASESIGSALGLWP